MAEREWKLAEGLVLRLLPGRQYLGDPKDAQLQRVKWRSRVDGAVWFIGQPAQPQTIVRPAAAPILYWRDSPIAVAIAAATAAKKKPTLAHLDAFEKYAASTGSVPLPKRSQGVQAVMKVLAAAAGPERPSKRKLETLAAGAPAEMQRWLLNTNRWPTDDELLTLCRTMVPGWGDAQHRTMVDDWNSAGMDYEATRLLTWLMSEANCGAQFYRLLSTEMRAAASGGAQNAVRPPKSVH